MSRVEVIGNATLYLGDCREVLPTLGKVDAVVTDPPYFRVLNETWDNEWDDDYAFLAWLGGIVAQLTQAMNPNGSLYLFASPQMASRVEVAIRRHLNVLAMITWNKGARRKGAGGSGVDVTSLRTFWQASSELIIFAERFGSDARANSDAGYTSACEATKRSVFGDYLSAEFTRFGVSRRQIAALFPSVTGGLTGCVSNWVMGYNCPTAEQYAAMRNLLGDGFLRREYEDLRREYEDLRREYEDLRRPFLISDKVQWSDVWEFDPPQSRDRTHPCEKPNSLMQHIVNASTRPGNTILDAFAGSGATGIAAVQMGRKFVGIERDPKYFDIACKRIEDAQRQGSLFGAAA